MGRSKRSKSTELVDVKKKNKKKGKSIKKGKRSSLDLIFAGAKKQRRQQKRREEPKDDQKNYRQRAKNGSFTKNKTNPTKKEQSFSKGKCKLPCPNRKTQSEKAPWLSEDDTNAQKTDGRQNAKEESFWRNLDHELEQFGKYVRLNEQECQARQQLVQTIREIAERTFAGKASCEIFGSFGVLPVCCFESDIDVAVFGVVETAEQVSNRINSHVRFGKKEAKLDKTKIKALEEAQKKQRVKLRAKKWTEAMATVDEANGITYGHEDTDSSGKTESDDSSSLPDHRKSLMDGTTAETAIDLLSSPQDNSDAPYSSGKTNSVITIDDSSNGDEENDGDNDSADKLEKYFSRKRSRSQDDEREDSSGYESSVSSNDATVLEDDMDLNLHVSIEAKPSPKVPPLWLRNKVLASLEELRRGLRKSKLFKTVMFIHRARVPIIKISTHQGFEIDVSIGGFGTDTSLYAKQQSEKYASFAVVVLFLKVLLSQQKLDTPFTGGLGSYKLYVLVAYHIHNHLAMGGSDRPGEVLMSFLYRFGCRSRPSKPKDGAKQTVLDQQTILQGIDGACADLSNVFRLDECLDLFQACWERLKRSNTQQKRRSYLVDLICPSQLQIARDERIWKLRQCSASVASPNPFLGNKRGLVGQQTSRKRKAPPTDDNKSHLKRRDLSANEIMARYGATF